MSLRERRKEETKSKLLGAARTAFAERGYQAAKTSEIAKDAGVAEGTLFNYFPTKAELFLAAMLPRREPESIRELKAGQPVAAKPPAAEAPSASRWAEAAVAIIDANLRGLAELEKGLQREFIALFYTARSGETAALTAFDQRIAEQVAAFFLTEKQVFPEALSAFDVNLPTECICALTLANYTLYVMEETMTYPELLSRTRRHIEFALAGHAIGGRG